MILIRLIITILILSQSFVFAATYTVINTNDSGLGSLRQAILDANTNPGADNIIFNIPGAGPHTIQINTTLIITEQVNLDGSTQSGSICPTNLLIVIDGSLLTPGAIPATPQSPALVLNNASGSIVKGLVINNCQIVAAGANEGVLKLINTDNSNIECNIIGLDATGSTETSNGAKSYGLFLVNSNTNFIGGTSTQQRNIISSNLRQIRIDTSDSNIIQGNFIGTDINGTIGIPNSVTGSTGGGIMLFFSKHTVIGGGNSGEGNVISGNYSSNLTYLGTSTGITVSLGSDSTIIQGNLIGTDVTGTINLGNAGLSVIGIPVLETGISVNSSHNLIGGVNSGEGNVIASNTYTTFGLTIIGQDAIDLVGSVSDALTNNTIQGNMIGTDISGMLEFPFQRGVNMSSADSTLIGGMVVNARNVIYYEGIGIHNYQNYTSGNLQVSRYNVIKGNYIGVNRLGLNFPNPPVGSVNGGGISLAAARNTIIGGYTVLERNITNGIVVGDSSQIINNFVGVDITGDTPIPNSRGIKLASLPLLSSTPLLSNPLDSILIINNVMSNATVFTNSGTHGIVCRHNTLSNFHIINNKIGVNADGLVARDNLGKGINLNTVVNGEIDGNIISNNGEEAIFINTIISSISTNIQITNNIIGSNITGGVAFGNGGVGVHIGDLESSIIDNNLISSSGLDAVKIRARLENCIVTNNKIGTDASGVFNFGNGGNGIDLLDDNFFNNIIGGLGQENIIAYNTGDAVSITGGSSTANNIGVNSMFCNGGLGINLNGAANINKAPPTVIVIILCPAGVDTIRGIALPNDTVEIYYDDLCAPSCQGRDYIATVIADASGNYIYTTNLLHQFVVATATDALGNTSEFGCTIADVFTLSNDTYICTENATLSAFGSSIDSYLWSTGETTPDITVSPSITTTYTLQGFGAGGCLLFTGSVTVNVACPLPVELLYFNALVESGNKVAITWATASEIDNDYFSIERSINGVDFELLKTRQGAGNSTSMINYNDDDLSPYRGVSYYRLKQTDFNGDYSYSDIVAVEFKEELSVYPNPASSFITINGCDFSLKNSIIIIYDVQGRVVMNKRIEKNRVSIQHLSKGFYYFKVINTNSYSKGSFLKV